MGKFKKYQKVRRIGDFRTDGILDGEVTIFPKIDGTNGSVWMDGQTVKAGSRKRELSLKKDNQNFYKYILTQSNLKEFLLEHSGFRLYGEWLVPHSLKTYTNEAWRKFYVFDVIDEEGRYLPYEAYKPLLEEYNIDYIPALASVKDSNEDILHDFLTQNNFLIQEQQGVGEGIVIKNYDYVNIEGDVIWAKIINLEFKESCKLAKKSQKVDFAEGVERRIIEKFVTQAFIEKEYAKIVTAKGHWQNEYIPEFLNRVFYELIEEEMWNILKAFKKPSINFNLLYNMTINEVKKVKKNIF